jgi:hypothetical protein
LRILIFQISKKIRSRPFSKYSFDNNPEFDARNISDVDHKEVLIHEPTIESLAYEDGWSGLQNPSLLLEHVRAKQLFHLKTTNTSVSERTFPEIEPRGGGLHLCSYITTASFWRLDGCFGGRPNFHF